MTEQHNPDFVGQQSVRAAERIYHQWDEALGAKDVDAVIALYGPGLRPGVAVRPASVELRGRRRRPTGKAAGIRANGLCAPAGGASAVSQRVLHRRAYADVGISTREAGRRANGLRRGDGDPGRVDPSPPGLLGVVWPQAAARGRSSRQITACGPSWRRFCPAHYLRRRRPAPQKSAVSSASRRIGALALGPRRGRAR